MARATWLAGGAAALLIGGCATAPEAPGVAPPAPPAPPPTAAAPSPPAPPASLNWDDRMPTPGDWRFVAAPAAEADYGEAGVPLLVLRCDAPGQRLLLVRSDTAPGAALTVRTSYGSRALTVAADGAVALPASDSLLDELVASRGRVAIEAPGLPPLTLPTWPEPARVVEECRPEP
ncbi:MAG: hypothetical protein JO013_10355 [Alphaproteobacteria bacterium]|nr:hypothetical protein [Alphaproteobacteria bacterium]